MDFKSDSVHFVVFVLVPMEGISCEQLTLNPGRFGCFRAVRGRASGNWHVASGNADSSFSLRS